jgi:hypothetical protein
MSLVAEVETRSEERAAGQVLGRVISEDKTPTNVHEEVAQDQGDLWSLSTIDNL